jgi:hypothetical protein
VQGYFVSVEIHSSLDKSKFFCFVYLNYKVCKHFSFIHSGVTTCAGLDFILLILFINGTPTCELESNTDIFKIEFSLLQDRVQADFMTYVSLHQGIS